MRMSSTSKKEKKTVGQRPRVSGDEPTSEDDENDGRFHLFQSSSVESFHLSLVDDNWLKKTKESEICKRYGERDPYPAFKDIKKELIRCVEFKSPKIMTLHFCAFRMYSIVFLQIVFFLESFS